MRTKPRAPKRPHAPNDKHQEGFQILLLRLPPATLANLRKRARYDTLHFRLEHDGKGPTVSVPDVARRIFDEYFAQTSALPDDAIGASLRERLK